ERVEGMLRFDERRDAASLLRLRDDMQGKGGLAGRLRTVDLGHPAARDTPHSERQVQRQRTCGDGGYLAALRKVLPQLHDRAFAIALRDLGHGRIEGSPFLLKGLIPFLVLVLVFVFVHLQSILLGRCGECSTSRVGKQRSLHAGFGACSERGFVCTSLAWRWF